MPSSLAAVFCLALASLLSLVAAEAEQVRNLAGAGSSTNGVPLAAVVGIAAAAAAAAAAVVLLVVVKVRSSGGSRRTKSVELHEVVISPSQPAAQPLSTTKQFVYTAHI